MQDLDPASMGAEVIVSLAKSVASEIYDKTSNFIKNKIRQNEIDYGIAFEEYLRRSQENVGLAKTILYGQSPHPLYSFFECTDIRSGDGERIDTSDINNLLDIGSKFIITGTGGIGKSMLMRHFFLNTIRNADLIPVLVELRGLNGTELSKLSLEDYIYKNLCDFGFRLEEEYFRYSLETGSYVILLDGYDEIKNDYSQKVAEEIGDFANRYGNNNYIVSSRPLQEFIGWSDFTEYRAMPLNKKQALSLISKLEYDSEVKEKFYKQLNSELYESYKSFASNPLLLTIMLMTFEERASIPDSRTDFYEQAFFCTLP